MSSAERQRKFQAAHPGYDRRRKARLRAACKTETKRRLAELFAKAAARAQAVPSQAVGASVADPGVKPVLMLPAPADDPTIDALDMLRASLERSVEHLSTSAR
jgi:hypothetical protein